MCRKSASSAFFIHASQRAGIKKLPMEEKPWMNSRDAVVVRLSMPPMRMTARLARFELIRRHPMQMDMKYNSCRAWGYW